MSDYEDDFDEEVSSPEKNNNPQKDTKTIPDESIIDDEDNTDGAFGASQKEEERGDQQHHTQHRKGSDVNSSAGQSWLSPTERKRVGSSMAGSPEPPEYLTRRTSDKGNETKKTEKSSRGTSKASSRSASAASSSSKKSSPHSRGRSRSHSSRHSTSRASSHHSSTGSAKNEKDTNVENEKEKPTTAGGKDSSRKSSRGSSHRSSSRRSRSLSSSHKSSRSPSPHRKGDDDDDQPEVDADHDDQPEFVTSVALTSSVRSSDSRKPSHFESEQRDENGTQNEETKKSSLFSTKAPPPQNQNTLPPPSKAVGRKKITPSPARPQPQPAVRGAGGARERSSSTVPPPVPKSNGGNGKRGPSPAAAPPPAPPQISQRDLGVLKMKNSELKRAIDDITSQLSQLAPNLASKLLRKTNSAGDVDKMNKLKKEMESLEKENETLQVRLRNADGLGGGIERHIAAREADIKELKARNKWLESEIRKNAKRLHDGGKMTFQQQRAALGDELRKEKQITQVLLDKVTRDTEQAVSAREQAETVLAALSERDPCPDWRLQDAKAVIELRAKIGEKIETMKGLRVRQRHAANNATSVALADESAKVMAANLETEINNMKRQAAELRTAINEGIIKRGGNVLSPNNPAASAAVMGGTGSTPTAATIASLITANGKAGDTSVASAVAMPKHGRRSDLDGTNNSVLDTTTGTSTTNSVSRALGIGPRRRDMSPQKGANTIAISPSAAPRKVPQPAATKSADADMWMGDAEATAAKESPQQAVNNSPPEDQKASSSTVSRNPSTKVNGKIPINEDPAWLALQHDDEKKRKNNKNHASSSKTTSPSSVKTALATNAKETKNKNNKSNNKQAVGSFDSKNPDGDAPWLEAENNGKKSPHSSRSHSSSPAVPSPASSRAASTPRSSRAASPSKSLSGSRRTSATAVATEAHAADNSTKPSADPSSMKTVTDDTEKAREEKRRKDAEAQTGAKKEKEAEEKRRQKDKEEREEAERRRKKQQEQEDEENERRKQKEKEAAAAAAPSWEAPDWMRDGEPAASDVKKPSPTEPSSSPSSPPAAHPPAAAPPAPTAAVSKTDDGDEPDWLKD